MIRSYDTSAQESLTIARLVSRAGEESERALGELLLAGDRRRSSPRSASRNGTL